MRERERERDETKREEREEKGRKKRQEKGGNNVCTRETYAMSSSSVPCFTTSHFYLTSEGHLCTHETCILQTSLKVGNFERRFMVCSQFKVSNNFLFLFDLNCMLMVNSDGL